MPEIRVTVDHDLCEGNMVCEANAPEIFEVRDDDLAYVLLDAVPGALLPAAHRAARFCPKQAIAVTEAPEQ